MPRLQTDKLIRTWREAKGEVTDAHNGALVNFRAGRIFYGSQNIGSGMEIGIRVQRKDGVLFILNGDEQGTNGWGNRGRVQSQVRRALNRVKDREDAYTNWRTIRKSAPEEPTVTDFGMVDPELQELKYAQRYMLDAKGYPIYSHKNPNYEQESEAYTKARDFNDKAREKASKDFAACGGADRYDKAHREWLDKYTYEGYSDTGEPVVYRDYNNVILSFSTLEAAGVNPDSVLVLDKTEEKNWTETVKDPKTGETHEIDRHLLGSVLFKAPIGVFEDRSETYIKKTFDHDEMWPGAVPPTDAEADAGGWCVRRAWGPTYTRGDIERYRPVYKSEEAVRTWKEEVGKEIVTFLAGLDESGTNPWSSYFVVRLPGTCNTVAEAYEMLKPQLVKDYEKLQFHIRRQGEWFFVPVPDRKARLLEDFEKKAQKARSASEKSEQSVTVGRGWRAKRQYKMLPPDMAELDTEGGEHITFTKGGRLPDSSPRGSSHDVSWIISSERDGVVTHYCRGKVTHSRNEHRVVDLKDVWHQPIENTALRLLGTVTHSQWEGTGGLTQQSRSRA